MSKVFVDDIIGGHVYRNHVTYVAKRRIPPVYLLDAAAELALIGVSRILFRSNSLSSREVATDIKKLS